MCVIVEVSPQVTHKCPKEHGFYCLPWMCVLALMRTVWLNPESSKPKWKWRIEKGAEKNMTKRFRGEKTVGGQNKAAYKI